MPEGDVLDAGGESLLGRAREFATQAHAGQLRKDGASPYIAHPAEVARLLEMEGAEETLLAAAYLHDVVEDTEVSLGEIHERFGSEIGELVAAMTEDDSIENFEERKTEHRNQIEAAGSQAIVIYLADKLANLRDLRTLYASRGEFAASRFKTSLDVRVRLWRGDLELGERALPDSRLVPALRSELDALDAERSGST